MGWLITFAVLFLLAVFPLGVGIRYDENGFAAKLVLGFVKLTVFPLPNWLKSLISKKPKQKPTQEQNQEPKPEAPKPEKQEPPKDTSKPAQPKGGSWTDFLPFVQLGLNFLSDFRWKLRLNHLVLNINLGGTDPSTLALVYGNTWAAVGNLLPRLERIFVIKKRDINITCDFTAEETTVIAQLEITITLGRIIALLAVYAVRAIKVFLTFKKKRNGGVQA